MQCLRCNSLQRIVRPFTLQTSATHPMATSEPGLQHAGAWAQQGSWCSQLVNVARPARCLRCSFCSQTDYVRSAVRAPSCHSLQRAVSLVESSPCFDMPSHSIDISDADAKASGVLRRMRLDGLDTATVPFGERCVRAWQRGAPEPGMDVELLIQVLWVSFCLTYLVTVCTPDLLLASIPVVLRQCSPPLLKSTRKSATTELERASIGSTHQQGIHL